MGIKEDYAKALELAKSEKYKQAIKVLKPHKDHLKVKPLWDKLQSNKPKRSVWKRVLIGISSLILLAVVGCGGLWFSMNWEWNFQGGKERFEWEWECRQVAITALINNDIDISDDIRLAYRSECERQSESNWLINSNEMKYCYRTTERGDLEAQYVNCLVENDIYIDGLMLGVAINNER